MNLPSPGAKYSADDQSRLRNSIERADRENHKRGRDVDIAPGRLILTSPDGTRWAVAADNSGALSTSVVG